MTRKEASEILKDEKFWHKKIGYRYPLAVAIDMAIEALEQEPCNDTVSRGVFKQVMWERDTAIEQLRKLGYELGQKIEPCDDCVLFNTDACPMGCVFREKPCEDFLSVESEVSDEER